MSRPSVGGFRLPDNPGGSPVPKRLWRSAGTRLSVLCGLAIAALIGTASGWYYTRWFRAELDRAGEEASRGYYGLARNRLARLVGRWPYQAEVAYKLGVCERARGRLEAALSAWSRVPPGTPFFADAAALRGTILIDLGRYA